MESDFLKFIGEVLDKDDNIRASDVFKDYEEWDSLSALLVIAMVDEKYQVRINGDDIRGSNTVGELFAIVNSRL